MNKRELLAAVAGEHPDMARSRVQGVVEALFDGIAEGLATAGRQSVPALGLFVVERRPPRPAKNPRTGAPVMADPSASVRFTADPAFVARVGGQGGGEGGEVAADPSLVDFAWRATGERHPRRLIGQLGGETVAAIAAGVHSDGRCAWPGFGSFKARPGGRVGFVAAAALRSRLLPPG